MSNPRDTAAAKTSRLPQLRKLAPAERLALVGSWANLSQDQQAALAGGGLSIEQANHMIENVIGTYALPFGIATNFQINQRDYLIPMVVEEPSIVAACSFAAKLAREGGGFLVNTDPPLMIGQIQLLGLDNVYAAAGRIWEAKAELLALANDPTSSIVKRGGGARDLELRPFVEQEMLIVHLIYDVRDAMGANAVNTACEQIAPRLAEISKGRVNLRILSNLADQRRAHARCRIPAAALTTETLAGVEVAASIVEAWRFAEIDPYRATTHNKGIMNGIDAVCIATGNDWRALEAGAHAYAHRDGQYRSLSRWWQNHETGDLQGELRLPLAVGTVGGATRVHAGAGAALQILGITSASELAGVMAAVGLAQNLAAIRALATDGIQRGHMQLHARQLAVAAGATAHQVDQVVAQMLAEKQIRLERAKQLVAALQSKQAENAVD
jgi:hydroxymethylglutaryl-CoA reductase